MPLEQHVWRPIKMNQGKWSVGDEKTKIKRIQISSRNQRKICSVVLCSKVLRSNDICSLRYLRRLLIQAVVVRKALSTFSFLYVSKCLWITLRVPSTIPHHRVPIPSCAEGSITTHMLQMGKQSHVARLGWEFRPAAEFLLLLATVSNGTFALILDSHSENICLCTNMADFEEVKTIFSQSSHLKWK